jgi:crotonobetainyl-CoA:carnitine CoA-transferase CaiB-like acyl-CoA transferase
VVENFRPGVMERIGLSYETLKTRNPALVYCSISGFGQTGPLRDKVSFDIVAQAMSGVMSINGAAQGPPTKLGLPMGDLAGGLVAVNAIQAALFQRATTGQGRYIDISLQDSLTYLLGYYSGIYFMTGESAGRYGSAHHNIVPYGSFPASDGFVVIAAYTEKFWRKLCAALEGPALREDPLFRDNQARCANREACDQAVAALTSKRTIRELTAVLDAGDVPNAPVYGIGEALEQEQLRSRNMVVEVDHARLGRIRVVGSPFGFNEQKGGQTISPPPTLGENTAEILTTVLGYSPADVDEVLAAGEQVMRADTGAAVEPS